MRSRTYVAAMRMVKWRSGAECGAALAIDREAGEEKPQWGLIFAIPVIVGTTTTGKGGHSTFHIVPGGDHATASLPQPS